MVALHLTFCELDAFRHSLARPSKRLSHSNVSSCLLILLSFPISFTQHFTVITIMSFGSGIGDIITVTELAISIYRDCYAVARGAP
jgi:hypothetical protein